MCISPNWEGLGRLCAELEVLDLAGVPVGCRVGGESAGRLGFLQIANTRKTWLCSSGSSLIPSGAALCPSCSQHLWVPFPCTLWNSDVCIHPGKPSTLHSHRLAQSVGAYFHPSCPNWDFQPVCCWAVTPVRFRQSVLLLSDFGTALG